MLGRGIKNDLYVMTQHQLYKDSLLNWRSQSSDSSGRVPVNWTDVDLELEWQETYSIDELPADDLWNTPAVSFKLWQEDLYKSWGHQKHCTMHYMAFEPELAFDIGPILEHLQTKNRYTMNFMKIPPGKLIPWHCDTYGYLIKKFDVPEHRIPLIQRTIVFMQDWSFGQVAQFGNSVISHWQAGDILTWPHQAWHGLANFGNESLIVMQVTNYD